MQPSLNLNLPVEHIIAIPRCDRWRIYYRLQELMISCSCPIDGSLRVEINDSTELILVRSIVQQFTASRQELVSWLERCWSTPLI
ncbi:Asr1405/Asl0597 family protein [Thermocoleostomius sinensis]|uniref:Uncharacterized protein n=1 Tax=Thermocoleostomius sinensis A174 TaxID=2016057 RepID=A0A9E9C5Q0_9CYAN|nr:Asr1405/Asl0597 family protein [Thermocoleostomius sinensis]WAL58414.1 hypothetical protein OXH18_14610 [Thermocoleostomius sinensis A174]